MNRVIALLLVVCALAGCDSADRSISDGIAHQVSSASMGLVDLRVLRVPDWQRMCVIGPYATNETIERRLGFKWDGTGKSSIGSNDGIYVLTFIKGNEVVAYTEHPRNKGDFLEFSPPCLQREDAVLIKAVDESGWIQLVSAKQRK